MDLFKLQFNTDVAASKAAMLFEMSVYFLYAKAQDIAVFFYISLIIARIAPFSLTDSNDIRRLLWR